MHCPYCEDTGFIKALMCKAGVVTHTLYRKTPKAETLHDEPKNGDIFLNHSVQVKVGRMSVQEAKTMAYQDVREKV